MADEGDSLLHLLETLIPMETKASDYILRLLQVLSVYNGIQKPELELLCCDLSLILEVKGLGCTQFSTRLTTNAASSKDCKAAYSCFSRAALLPNILKQYPVFLSRKNSWRD